MSHLPYTLTIPEPEKDGKPIRYIFLVRGENLNDSVSIRVVDEGGCGEPEGCKFDDHEPFHIGELRILSEIPLEKTEELQDAYKACGSCKPVKRMVYTLHAA
jgi:hypothetical protein